MVRPVAFVTAFGKERDRFLWTLYRVSSALPRSPRSISDIQVLGSDSKSVEEDLMMHLHDGKEVVVDANSLYSTLEQLGPLPHEYLARLHMVVDRSPESTPVVVDYLIGEALDLLNVESSPN